jgi:hypothetical protein
VKEVEVEEVELETCCFCFKRPRRRLKKVRITDDNTVEDEPIKWKRKKIINQEPAETKESSINPFELANMSYEIPDGTSLVDLEEHEDLKMQIIIARRKRKRNENKVAAAARGEIDVVMLNSGPPPHMVPSGYRVAPVAPELTPSSLLGKRVMYLFESKNPRRNGWFLGSISSESRKAGCNFNIKFDHSETGTVFVSGIENCNLTLSGENAYGRRWVILDNSDDVV